MKRLLIVLAAVVMVTSFALDAEAGLFGRRKSKCCQPCCQPTCCEAAPSCGCEAAPACGCEAAAPAPACGCEASACCEPQPCCQQLSRREMRKARRNGCCVETCSYQAPACGCEAAPACGCEASAPCGCSGATPIESAPADGAAPEAAPEAPAPAA